ncbi:uncharacterized protein TNCV_4735481 [Trichonephila clavipes]|nr:uncharacterized protein TNCV_4735481 [Trichonephila clavipes]
MLTSYSFISEKDGGRGSHVVTSSQTRGPCLRITGSKHNAFEDQLSGCGSPVAKVSEHGRHFMSSSLVPLKNCPVGERCTFHLSRAETSSHWCSVVVRRGGSSSCVVLVT